MSTWVKWLLSIVGVIVLLLVGVAVTVRVQMGPLNFPPLSGALEPEILQQQLMLPPNFTIGTYATGVAGARNLLFTPSGDLLVSVPGDGRIVLLSADDDGDGHADSERQLMSGLSHPSGMAIREGYLYIGETHQIGRIQYDAEAGQLAGEYEVVVPGLPRGGNHPKKIIGFGPDDRLYVAIGSTCNVCIEEDERRATMMRFSPDGQDGEIVARGLRSSVGFAWDLDGTLYATDNGRDALGDDYPPCELNEVVVGGHYGWPFVNGFGDPDPDYGDDDSQPAQTVAPVHGFRAHTAPLGISFIQGEKFPEAYRGVALVALHGSWNRSERDGYSLVSLHWQNDGSIEERDLVAGFVGEDETVYGRPADVKEGPDGAIYFSDDFTGTIYRVAYGEPQSLLATSRPTTASGLDPEVTLAKFSPDERKRLAEVGQNIFEADQCARCHEAKPGNKVLKDIGQRYDLVSLGQLLQKPPPPMPLLPYTDDDRRALSVYLIETY
ncbi:MAG: PQQ-dependent sugar dehydrogenase [Pseudomonadota bacterium]